jgi:Methyltransferase domain
MRGIRFDLGAQIEFLERELAPLLKQFGLASGVEARYGYEPQNPSYPPPDARLLFAMIRWLRPRAVVELGSGQTSRVIAHACRLNAVEGHECQFRAFDPYPTTIDAGLPGLTELVLTDAQSVSETLFSELGDGDVLVVDTTHTVKLGSEVNRLVLRLLPLLAPGVHVHFHDIWLPYEYPRYLADQYALYWAEQYLLQAFLCMNPGFEVVCAAHALIRDRPDAAAAVGLSARDESGASFWIRRSAESAHSRNQST